MPHLSPARLASDLLFLSGEVAFDSSGHVSGDIVAQTRGCLERLEGVLQQHGLDRSAIVKTNVWIVNQEDFTAFDETYADFFGDHKPARSTVVSSLALAAAVVEIDAIAIVTSR